MDRWMHKENVIYTKEYYTTLKEGNPVICNNMDEHGGYYAKWNKPDKERQIHYGITYTESLKKSQTHRNRVEKRLPGPIIG